MRRDMEDGPAALRRLQLQAEPTTAVRTEDDVASGDEGSDAEFEFPFVGRESAPAADELFAGGRIRAFYPVFGRVLDEEAPAPALGRLFKLEEARTSSVASTSSSSSSSTADTGAGADLDGASPDSYCLWTPGSASAASSPSRGGGPPRKSGSTGSIPRWRRIGELVVGRSHSDGKDKFLFLSAPPSPARDSKAKQPPKGTKSAAAAAVATELDTVAAGRRLSYSGAKASAAGGRRTFLPYRQDLVGLFANVHGLRSR